MLTRQEWDRTEDNVMEASVTNGSRMNQVHFLLQLSENAQARGDELTRNQNDIYSTHARDLVELSRMIEMAKANIDVELERFSRWIPRENVNPHAKPKELPRVVTGAGTEVKAHR